MFISLLDTGIFYQCSLPSAYVRKDQNILLYHYFQLKFWLIHRSNGHKKGHGRSLSHLCLFECHYFCSVLSKFWFKQKTWPPGAVSNLCLYSGRHHTLSCTHFEFAEHCGAIGILSSKDIMNNICKMGSMNPWTHGIYLLCPCHTQLSCQTSLSNTNYELQLLWISTQWALNQVQGHAEYRIWCRYINHASMKSTLSVVCKKKERKKFNEVNLKI